MKLTYGWIKPQFTDTPAFGYLNWHILKLGICGMFALGWVPFGFECDKYGLYLAGGVFELHFWKLEDE